MAASENPAWLRHKIRNICIISEPLGDSKPLRATEEREEGGVWGTHFFHHTLALRWTQGTSERDSNTHAGYSAAPQEPTWVGSWLMGLMGLRKPREAASLCQKQATGKKDRSKREQLMRLKRIIPSPQGPTDKHRFFCKRTDALDTWVNSFPSFVLEQLTNLKENSSFQTHTNKHTPVTH